MHEGYWLISNSITWWLRRYRLSIATLSLSVALVLSALLGVVLAGQGATRSAQGSIDRLSQRSGVEIRSHAGSISESELATIGKTLASAGTLIPMYERAVQWQGHVVTLLGTDASRWLSESSDALRPIVSREYARELGIRDGTPFAVLDEYGQALSLGQVRVVDDRELPDAVIIDLVIARAHFGASPTWLLSVNPSIDLSTVTLPKPLYVSVAAQRVSDQAALLGAFNLNITIMTLLTALVAAAIIFNGAQSFASELSSDVLTLSSLGCDKRIIFAYVMGLPFISCLCGVGFAVVFGRTLVRWCQELVSTTATTLYLQNRQILSASVSEYLFTILLVSASVLIICMMGASIPAWKMCAEPLVVRPQETYRKPRLSSNWLIIFILGSALLGMLLVWLALFARVALYAHAASLAGIVVVAAAAPLLMRSFTTYVSRLSEKTTSFPLTVATEMLSQNDHAVGFATAVLAVALTLVVGLSVMVTNFRVSLADWAVKTTRSDYFIKATPRGQASTAAALPSGLVESITKLPGVRMVQRRSVPDRSINGVGVVGVELRPDALDMVKGDIREWAADTVLVNEAAYRDRGATREVGSEQIINGKKFKVIGVIRDFATQGAAMLMQWSAFETLFGGAEIAALEVEADSTSTVQQNLQDVVGRYGVVASRSRLRDLILSTFDQTFEITRVMRLLVLIMAIAVVVACVVQILHERYAELSLLTTLGASRGELSGSLAIGWILTLLPTLAIGCFGGLSLAYLLVRVINPLSFNWSFPFFVPWMVIVREVGIVTVASGLMILLGVSLSRKQAFRSQLIDD